MAEERAKYNKGNIAEAIVGAALFAKFINRPKDKKSNYPDLTLGMVEDVLAEYYGSYTVGKVLKKSVTDPGTKVKDNMTLQINIPQADTDILKAKKTRQMDVLKDLYSSAIEYVNETWKSDAIQFALNGIIDAVDVHSDGTGAQTQTKADIKITHNGQSYSRQISLKVAGGDQFAQVSGEEFTKQISVWKKTLGIDIVGLEKKYNKLLENYDKDIVFTSRENARLKTLKKILKEAGRFVYGQAAKELKSMINSKNSAFYTTLTKLIANSATLGEPGIELVKLEKGTYKRIAFTPTFIKDYTNLLKSKKILVQFDEEEGDPKVELYVDSVKSSNRLLQIRVKVESPSSKSGGKKTYKPYMRNLIEAGPMMYDLAKQLDEMNKKGKK